ncbi:MAG: ABC transporter permease [Actinomycetota bacterium]|jgi:ABC-2 type transport system permease protein|nr:ABC transporter permease [Actinomycetota bacterium]
MVDDQGQQVGAGSALAPGGRPAPRAGASAPAASVVGVRVAGGTLNDDLRAIRVVWKRELIRFSRNRIRIVTSLVQPILFLFVLGTGLSPILSGSDHFNFRTFMFPGVIGMTVLFTAIFSAISIVWDREFGFLREMLVAPVHRSALVLGKCLGGATVATIQGAIMLALAGAVGVPYHPLMLLILIGEIALTAFALTVFGVLMASRISQIEAFQVVTQMVVLPMFFLSGAIFPTSKLPQWLAVLTKIDPLSYAVDPLRRTVFSQIALSPRLNALLNPGVTWNGWRLPTLLELAMVAVAAGVMLFVAILQFSRTD